MSTMTSFKRLSVEYKTEIEANEIPIEVTVGFDYESPCGDGWHEPRLYKDVSIYSVTDKDGNEVDYTPGHEAFLADEILADLHRKAAEYEADKAEYQY